MVKASQEKTFIDLVRKWKCQLSVRYLCIIWQQFENFDFEAFQLEKKGKLLGTSAKEQKMETKIHQICII